MTSSRLSRWPAALQACAHQKGVMLNTGMKLLLVALVACACGGGWPQTASPHDLPATPALPVPKTQPLSAELHNMARTTSVMHLKRAAAGAQGARELPGARQLQGDGILPAATKLIDAVRDGAFGNVPNATVNIQTDSTEVCACLGHCCLGLRVVFGGCVGGCGAGSWPCHKTPTPATSCDWHQGVDGAALLIDPTVNGTKTFALANVGVAAGEHAPGCMTADGAAVVSPGPAPQPRTHNHSTPPPGLLTIRQTVTGLRCWAAPWLATM